MQIDLDVADITSDHVLYGGDSDPQLTELLNPSQPIAFDIETGPREQEWLVECFGQYEPEPFDASAVKLGNLKKPDLIREKLQSAEIKHLEDQTKKATEFNEKNYGKAALNAGTGRTLCIGYRQDKTLVIQGVPHAIRAGGPLSDKFESALLRSFWELATAVDDNGGRLFGWNIFGFDLSFMTQRVIILGHRPPDHLLKGRYWSKSFVDLMEQWTVGSSNSRVPLAVVAGYLGLGGKVGDGASFGEYWENDHQAAIEYSKQDMYLTWKIGERIGVA